MISLTITLFNISILERADEAPGREVRGRQLLAFETSSVLFFVEGK